MWPGNITVAAIENRLHQRIATGYDIANYPEIGGERKLTGIKTFDQFDSLFLELGAHRGVHVGVAAGDPMTGGAGNHRNPAHEGAADTKNMDMH